MKLLKSGIALLIALLSLFFTGSAVNAQDNKFVTVVNPVRISRYTKSPEESVRTQYSVISENNLPATWLLTYDAIEDRGVASVAASMNKNQELGIFLEVTSNFAEASGVEYRNTGFWHHATSVFLSGYSKEQRVSFIDTVFEKFMEEFGYYPTSVGAWWVDSYSLEYMQERYGVTASLGVADQFSTDGYQVWGQYWSTPFYPSNIHAGVPASSQDNKIDVVVTQWAPRDPLNGYYSSLYSTQDYSISKVGLETDYLEDLIKTFVFNSENKFGHITVGLEGDLEPQTYGGEFSKQMSLVARLIEDGDLETLTMKEFSSWYRNTFEEVSPDHFLFTDDLLGETNNIAFWYQSPNYRIGLIHDQDTKVTKIVDFRSYHSEFKEPYYDSPNKEFILWVNIPSYFDEISNPEDVWNLELGEITEVKRGEDKTEILFGKENYISFEKDMISLKGVDEVPQVLSESEALETSLGDGVKIQIKDSWLAPKDGVKIRDLTPEASHLLATRRGMAASILAIVLFVGVNGLIAFLKISDRKKLAFMTVTVFVPLAALGIWYNRNSVNYYVSQAEVDALFRLSVQEEGKVVVVDKECLSCSWSTPSKPAAFGNKRDYVRKLGGHPIVYNSSVFEAVDQSTAKEEFDKLRAKYIYLVKYEDYIEKTPFSPGDLNIEKIYSNANAEIWRVKE